MNDEQLLEHMLRNYRDDLTPDQRRAFSSMAGLAALSDKQRKWIQGVAERLGIQVAPCANAFSSLSEKKQQEHREKVSTKLPWEKDGVQKALKPPGRKT